jgi:hypothetical protein
VSRGSPAVERHTASVAARNLRAVKSGGIDTFWTVEERQQFYSWFYERAAVEKKSEIRWPLAAAVISYRVHLYGSVECVATLGHSSNTLRAFLRRANQCIFDDALPKLQLLWDTDTSISAMRTTGQSAIDWDARILSEEQNLIQPLYEELSKDDLKRLQILASQTGPTIAFGLRLYDDTVRQVLSGPGRVARPVKPFDGYLLSPSQRWRYGMTMAAAISSLIVRGSLPTQMPIPQAEYIDRTALMKVDHYPRLHLFEAINQGRRSTYAASQAADLMQTFTPLEQHAFLGHHRFRLPVQRAAMPWAELRRGMITFTADLTAQLEMLDTFPGRNWSATNYSDIRPMITKAPPAQKAPLRSDRWRSVFAAVCDNRSILTAVDDLGIENSERKAWVDAERAYIHRDNKAAN